MVEIGLYNSLLARVVIPFPSTVNFNIVNKRPEQYSLFSSCSDRWFALVGTSSELSIIYMEVQLHEPFP